MVDGSFKARFERADRNLIDVFPVDRELAVVLYELPYNRYHPYATWVVRLDDPQNTFWGHYFEDLPTAEMDFERRIRKYKD